ncbi:hypothetical protein QCN29_28740 [Streptomyces sp. HNM0663]|uniref:Secreted protein n=1 Tax=Streptomyces chengmaiensis TaxID=3040919 RepID=A0ABT6HVG0_9ACTN|nr:hypothetical protein [Streptomyces chengmaiensis]MDH2392696.1 hypothetical protein [Streptomyces chengmaiensis]
MTALAATLVLLAGSGPEREAVGQPDASPAATAPSATPPRTEATLSPQPSTSTPQPAKPPQSPQTQQAQAQKQDEISRQRAEAEAVPDAIPITPAPRESGPVEGSEDFGKAVLTDGDLTVYQPRARASSTVLPMKVTNSGTEWAAYDIAVRITGPDGFDEIVTLNNGEPFGVFPGTSWPSEVTVDSDGKPLPKEPAISIVKNNRQERRSWVHP